MSKPYTISYSAYGKDTYITDLTEGEATTALRSLVKNFYNRETGCTNGLLRHYGEISITKNFKPILTFSSGEFFSWKKGNGTIVADWETIFTEKVSKIA